MSNTNFDINDDAICSRCLGAILVPNPGSSFCQACDKDELALQKLEDRYYHHLQSAITVLKQDHPEFEEEHTTGWDLIQTLEEIALQFRNY